MHSADVVNTGFTQDETSQVVVQVVYDELAALDDYEGVDITRLTRELSTKNSFGLNLMHISVDGQPIDDPDRSSSDVQRCTDVALDKADIQFQFDNLAVAPAAERRRIADRRAVLPAREGHLFGQPVRFSMYANYWSFIERAEVRIFARPASRSRTPRSTVVDDRSQRPCRMAAYRAARRSVRARAEVRAARLRQERPVRRHATTIAVDDDCTTRSDLEG